MKRSFRDCSISVNAKSCSSESGQVKKASCFGGWKFALFKAMETKDEFHIFEDDKVVAIKDHYPKARNHVLVISRKKINGISELTLEDLPLIEHMERIGKQLAEKESLDESQWRLGYHAVPSLPPLHLHVISDDFESKSLRTKKHWNSFTTAFFRNSKDVIEELREKGKVHIDKNYYQTLLGQTLRCFVCEQQFSTMPKLLTHYTACRKAGHNK